MGVIGVLLLVLGLIIMMSGMTIGMAVRSGAVEQGGKINRREEWRLGLRTREGLLSILIFMVGVILMSVGVALSVASDQ